MVDLLSDLLAFCDRSCPPSVNVAPPSSEYIKPDWRQPAQRNRANPAARQPHVRKSRNSCSTKRGSPSPSGATRPACGTSRSARGRVDAGRCGRAVAARSACSAGPRPRAGAADANHASDESGLFQRRVWRDAQFLPTRGSPSIAVPAMGTADDNGTAVQRSESRGPGVSPALLHSIRQD